MHVIVSLLTVISSWQLCINHERALSESRSCEVNGPGDYEHCTTEDDARSGDISVKLTDIPHDLFFRVQRAGDALVSKAPAFISNSTSNLVECFMSTCCKFDGGKVYNRTQRESFQHRCCGAGLRFQLGADWASQVWEDVTGEKPGGNMIDYYYQKAKRHASEKKRKLSDSYKEQRKRSRYYTTTQPQIQLQTYEACVQYMYVYAAVVTCSVSGCVFNWLSALFTRYTDRRDKYNENIADRDYGPNSDISLPELGRLCSEYKNDLNISGAEAQQIEEDTRQQSNDTSGMWMSLRRCRLTASNFGVICK